MLCFLSNISMRTCRHTQHTQTACFLCYHRSRPFRFATAPGRELRDAGLLAAAALLLLMPAVRRTGVRGLEP